MEWRRLEGNKCSNCFQGLAPSQLKLFGRWTKPKDIVLITPPLTCEHMEIQAEELSSSTEITLRLCDI